MKTDEALDLAKKLRAEGVSRVEFEGDQIKALELRDPGPPAPTAEEEADRRNVEDDFDKNSRPFEVAIRQMNTGKFAGKGS